MNKEEIVKIRKYVLKVNIHCDGCKHKVKKVLRQIDGVFTIEIDSEQGKVIVSGNVDSDVLIKKLLKSGKHAEIWGALKANDNNNTISNNNNTTTTSTNNNNKNQNQLSNKMKNMHVGISQQGGGGIDKCQQKASKNNQPMPKGVQQPSNPQQMQQQLIQHHLQQQLQQMKGLQNQKLPLQLKDMKQLGQSNPNPKAVKFSLPEDDIFSNNEFDDDEIDDLRAPLNKMKGPPPMGTGAHMIMNGMMNGNQQEQFQNPLKNVYVETKEKKGGGLVGEGSVPIQIPGLIGGNDVGNWGKKCGVGGRNNQNQGGRNKNNDDKNGGRMQEVKNCNNVNKYGGGVSMGNHGNNNGNMDKKGNMMHEGVQVMNPMGGGYHPTIGGPSMGPMGNMNMATGEMGNMNMPMAAMGNIPAVQGLPTGGMNSGGGGGDANEDRGGYFKGTPPKSMPGNPFLHHHQQHMAAVMNQQRAMGMASVGNDQISQPIMYAQPPLAVNYMYPQQYPSYPCAPPPQYTHLFNDENTSSCSIV